MGTPLSDAETGVRDMRHWLILEVISLWLPCCGLIYAAWFWFWAPTQMVLWVMTGDPNRLWTMTPDGIFGLTMLLPWAVAFLGTGYAWLAGLYAILALYMWVANDYDQHGVS